jgi:lipopolysaccharide assembly outer membrane protein LptD (OstA)
MKRVSKIRPKYLFCVVFTAVILCTVTWKTAANDVSGKMFYSPLTTQQEDSNKIKNPIGVNRQLPDIVTDTSKFKRKDSLRVVTDTFALKLSKDSLDAPVHYSAEDSAVVLILEKKIILYGKTKIEHKTITLTAPQVELDQATQMLTAVNKKDSTGAITEQAEFKDGDQAFTSDTIRFNFKTQKGLTKNTFTEQSGIFLQSEISKKVSANTTYAKRVRFTTCNLDEPHFAFLTNKMKIINQKLGVSGPAHPEFEGVPIPVYLPFGFYPLSQGRHSGLIAPQFANNEQMGVGLENLGYYKVLNDYWDVKVYGNIYSYGGWSGNISPTYRKRYRYGGAFNFSMQSTKQNFKGDPDYVKNNSYFITWSHSVDSRARPGTTFSANVNAGSTKFNQYIPNNTQRNFQNQLGSSIAYSKTWKDKPFNLTLSANHNQNNLTHLINVSLPDAGFTVSTLYPFQKKEFVGSPKWYEKLGIGYNGAFRNQFSFYDTAFRFKQLIDTLQWGAQHNIPITVSLPPLFGGALMIAPSVSYSQVWIAQKVQMKWNTAKQKLDTTSITKGLFIDQTAQFSVGLSTAIFGTYQFKNKKIEAIRHVVRPTLSMNYKPDLSKKHYYTDTIYTGYTGRLSEFSGSLYGGYSEGKTGGASFQLDNTLEMKVKTKDSTSEKPTKVVRLIDGYGLSTGYNFLRDSLKLDYINLYFRTNLFEKISINANATMNPYKSDSIGRDIDKYAWTGGKFSPGRLTSGSISVSTSFQSKPKDAEKDKKKQEEIRNNLETPELRSDQQRLLEYAKQNPSEFVDFNIPWQVSLSYSLNFYEERKTDYSGFNRKFSSNMNFNGSFNLTPKWNFSVNGAYDFDTKAIQYFTMSIAREMHCWQMSINVTPIGLYRYFNLSISPKSPILQDLRINRTRSFNSY